MADVIVFVDVETTVPSRSGQGFSLLEFGAILVCPRKLFELDSFSTLIRPANLSSVSATSVRCNGITRDAVAAAPTFCEVADKVYDILHGRVWAGHNIVRFDCLRIREAFAEIGRPAPEPKGTIDSLALLTQRFGRRAGNMKMATLATYFGLGEQKHRHEVFQQTKSIELEGFNDFLRGGRDPRPIWMVVMGRKNKSKQQNHIKHLDLEARPKPVHHQDLIPVLFSSWGVYQPAHVMSWMQSFVLVMPPKLLKCKIRSMKKPLQCSLGEDL